MTNKSRTILEYGVVMLVKSILWGFVMILVGLIALLTFMTEHFVLCSLALATLFVVLLAFVGEIEDEINDLIDG